MAQHYDVSLKALFMREGDGIIRRMLFGSRITGCLPTEQPLVFNRRADMVAQTEDGDIRQLEFQASNEPNFALRMLEYYTYFLRALGHHVAQVVLYLGPQPMRLESALKTPTMDYRFQVINLRELEAGPLLASPDWADNVLAILAKGDPEEALRAVLPRIQEMTGDEREWAAGTLLFLSGIIGIEGTVRERLKETGMIDIMQNKVLGPMLRQQFKDGRSQGLNEGVRQGHSKGLREGRNKGQRALLHTLLTEKFGDLPKWAEKRLKIATSTEMEIWAKRVLAAATLEATLLD